MNTHVFLICVYLLFNIHDKQRKELTSIKQTAKSQRNRGDFDMHLYVSRANVQMLNIHSKHYSYMWYTVIILCFFDSKTLRILSYCLWVIPCQINQQSGPSDLRFL